MSVLLQLKQTKTPRKTQKMSTRRGSVFTFELPGGRLAPLSVTPLRRSVSTHRKTVGTVNSEIVRFALTGQKVEAKLTYQKYCLH